MALGQFAGLQCAATNSGPKVNPRAESQKAGLSEDHCIALENLDWIGLEMAARSFAKKRRMKRRPNWFDVFRSRFTRLRFFHFGQK